ncbi:MAG: MATE family efflux transporter [Defluviitaleaceae bacterium]|nr:MATE family efflux transporter [Defluviitaleaceae bacterium]
MLKLSAEQKKFFRLLLTVAPPVAMQEVLNASVFMVDTLMIGRAMGVSQVAAVGLANQITFLYMLMVFGIISASGVFSGQFFGKGDIVSIHKIMGIGFLGTGFTAFIFFVAGFFFPTQLISIYSQDPEVIEMGANFLQIISVAYLISAITITRNAAMRSMRQTKFPMVSTAIALLANVTMNYFAIFVFDFGLTGVAVGTVISRILEIIAQEFFIRHYKIAIIAPIKKYFDFDIAFLKNFLKIGAFIIFNEVTWAVGTSIYNIAYGIVGTDAQGSIQISWAMVNIFQVFGNSLAVSTGILVSNKLGEKKSELAEKYAHWSIIGGITICIIMGGLLIAFSPFLASFYNLEPQVENDVINLLRIAAATMLFRTSNFIMIVGILRSGGDTKWCFWLEIMTVYLVGVPLGFLGAFLGLPVYWVFSLVMLDEIVKSIFALRRVLSKIWVKTIV